VLFSVGCRYDSLVDVGVIFCRKYMCFSVGSMCNSL
jgi:hypothetical protein